MSKATKLPYYAIDSQQLADWLDRQPGGWWNVDGDPLLTSRIDFPCPAEELSSELRRINRELRIFDPQENSRANGEPLSSAKLHDMADTENNSQARTFLLCWKGEEIQWLMAEDRAVADESV